MTVGSLGRQTCLELAGQNSGGCPDIPPKSNQRSAFAPGCLDAFNVIYPQVLAPFGGCHRTGVVTLLSRS